MSWYAAHLILHVQLKKQHQDHFPVWENIVLIKADSEEEAFAKAEQRGHEDEGNSNGTFRWNGQPAAWAFAGIRKLVCVPRSRRTARRWYRDHLQRNGSRFQRGSEEARGRPSRHLCGLEIASSQRIQARKEKGTRFWRARSVSDNSNLRILGIDPGLQITGYAVIASGERRPQVCEAGVIRGQESVALRTWPGGCATFTMASKKSSASSIPQLWPSSNCTLTTSTRAPQF